MVTAEVVTPESTDENLSSPGRPAGWWGRWQIPTFLVGLVMLVASLVRPLGLGTSTSSLTDARAREALERALNALDAGNHAAARAIAEQMQAGNLSAPEFPGGAAYVLGMLSYAEAEEKHGPRARGLYAQAARLLEEAHNRGTSADRARLLVFRLGKSLLMSGHNEQSIAWLKEAAEPDDPNQVTAHELLVDAYSEGNERDLQEALHVSDLLLQLGLTRAERDRAFLQRGKILMKLGRHAEAAEALEKISPEGPEARLGMLLRVRALIAQGAYAPALEALETITGDKSQHGSTLLQALYLTGVARQKLGQHQEALASFDRVQQLDPHSDEAVVAALDTATILGKLARPKESLASYLAALEQIESPETFHNPWIEFADLQKRIQGAWDSLYEAEQYENAFELAAASVNVLGETTATLLGARTLEQWGRALRLQAEQVDFNKAQPLLVLADEHLRKAGQAYRHLAELRKPTAYYPEDIWHSADCFLTGNDYEAAVSAYELFLSTNPQTRRPQALVSLGKALMALERYDAAVDSFEQCRQIAPKDPATFQADYLKGVCYVEMGNAKQAEQVFRENLEGEYLNPSAVEWRQSLFALGKLLHQTGQYDAAIEKLSEAVERYPEDETSDEARYLIAESYRKSAATPKENLKAARNDAVRDHWREETNRRLYQALDAYQSLQARLLARQRERDLSRHEDKLLRNCYFAIGQCWYAMDNYLEAKDAYSTAANRYQQQAVVLDAYVEIANCFRRLGDAGAARSTLETARIVLKRIPDDAFELPATSLSRAEWENWLEWAINQ